MNITVRSGYYKAHAGMKKPEDRLMIEVICHDAASEREFDIAVNRQLAVTVDAPHQLSLQPVKRGCMFRADGKNSKIRRVQFSGLSLPRNVAILRAHKLSNAKEWLLEDGELVLTLDENAQEPTQHVHVLDRARREPEQVAPEPVVAEPVPPTAVVVLPPADRQLRRNITASVMINMPDGSDLWYEQVDLATALQVAILLDKARK